MKRSEIFFSVVLVPVDFVMILLAALTAYWFRFGQYARSLRPITFELSLQVYLGYAVIVAILWLVIFVLAKMYTMTAVRRPQEEFQRLFFACTAGIVVVILADFARHELFSSRFIVLAVWLLAIIYVGLGRWIIRRIQKSLLKNGTGLHRLVLIGSDSAAQLLAQNFKQDYRLGYQVVNSFPNFSQQTRQALVQLLKQDQFDEILAGSPHLTKEELRDLYNFSYEYHLPLKYVADLFEAQAPNIEISVLSGIPIVELKKTRLDGWGKVIKRLFDLTVSGLAIVIFSPVMLVVTLAIKFDSAGPAFFSYQRIGQFGKTFRYFKFRSMFNNTHQLRYDEEFVKQHQNLRAGTPMIKIKDDPRITKVGRFIRRYSLDELSELFLVFTGKMSLVGPRPHEVEEVAKYDQYQRRVLTIKPGMTGLAQVSGRSDLDFTEEINLDIYYIENWSLWQDVLIILKTPLAVLRKRQTN